MATCLKHLVIFLVLALAPPALATAPPLTIGASYSLTGKYSAMGNMQEKGLALWARQANAAGGLLGRKVKLVIRDDQSSPQKAADIYQRLITKDKVDLVVGPYSSGISEAIAPVVEKYGYPTLLSGASADRLWEKGFRNIFGVYTPASKYAVGFLEMLVTHNLNRLAVISADDSFSASLAANIRRWARKFGLRVVCYESFKKGTRDLNSYAQKAKAAGAQVVMVCGHLNESVDMRRAFKAMAWTPQAYYASVGPATSNYHKILGPDAEGTFSSSQWEAQTGRFFPRGNKFIASFEKAYGIPPTYHAATAYAAGMIIEHALQKTGSADRAQLRDAFSTMQAMTVIGRYGVDKTGRQVRHFPLIIQWQNGEKQVVWPRGLRVAKPLFGK